VPSHCHHPLPGPCPLSQAPAQCHTRWRSWSLRAGLKGELSSGSAVDRLSSQLPLSSCWDMVSPMPDAFWALM
jgi:hypothetical protein